MRKIILVLVLAATAASFGWTQPSGGQPGILAIPGIQAGSRLVLFIRGDASDGKVWGTETYSSDSNLASAAVHAGILSQGQTGMVTIDLLTGPLSYTGSSRNGVTSQSSGATPLGFRFSGPAQGVSGLPPVAANTPIPPKPVLPVQPVQPVQPIQPQPPVTNSYRIYAFSDPGILGRISERKPGTRLLFQITASTGGAIWGSGTYTLNSNLATAAVHAGILSPGQRGLVEVTLRAGQASYAGSTRNGVNSNSYSSYPTSYSLEPVWENGPVTEMVLDPGSVDAYPAVRPGLSIVAWVTGKRSGGTVWGSDPYTSDSPIAVAAVHDSILEDGESGPVLIKVLPGQPSYRASSRNGVSTAEYGAYSLSYSLEKIY